MWIPLSKNCSITTLIGGLLVAIANPQARAATEYDTATLLNAPQPAYDLLQARPALELHRPINGGMNDAGQLTGSGDAGSTQHPQDTRPFFYDPAEHTNANLGDLTGDFADQAVTPRNDASKGMGINDLGWVVGVSSTATTIGSADDRPFFWFDDDANHANSPDEMRELTLNPGATHGSALRISNSGWALINGDSGLYRASLALDSGVLSETAARTFIANADNTVDINETGDVAFISGNAGYVWRDLDADSTADPSEITQIPFMSDVSTSTCVFSINNAGQVAGTMRNAHNQDIAFIWTDLDNDNTPDWNDANSNGYFEANETSAEFVRFHGDAGGISSGTGRTFLFDINDHGQAVGGYFDDSERKAFIYDKANGMRFLNDMVATSFTLDIRQATAINNEGQIATFSKTSYNTTDQLVLLSPVGTAIEGDLDNDGFVGIADLNIVLGNWNQSVPPGDPSAGDPSADGFVGIEDLNTVLGNWNAGTPPAPESPKTLSTAPEPATVVLLGTGGLMCVRGRTVRNGPTR